MKKRILLIGNTDGLPGVNEDIVNYSNYFKSLDGGEWYDFEIITLRNTTVHELNLTILRLKSLQLDYLIVIFSGHGGSLSRKTILELSDGEEVNETELMRIAPRQLNIYDCCRSVILSPLQESSKSMRMYCSEAQASISTRREYENRIMQAVAQQSSLYACMLGEVSEDTPRGGVYSSRLLKAAKDFGGDHFIIIGKAHSYATKMIKDDKYEQNPDSRLPRCFTSQSLIWSIDPFY